jgi:hypothetical protein
MNKSRASVPSVPSENAQSRIDKPNTRTKSQKESVRELSELTIVPSEKSGRCS